MRGYLSLFLALSTIGCVKVTETVVVYADATTPDAQEPADAGFADIGPLDMGLTVNVCAGLQCGEVAGISCGTCSGSTEVCYSNRCIDVCAGLTCGTVAGISCGTCTGTDRCELNYCVKDGMVLVPGGPFFMGCNDAVDTECEDNERPGGPVDVQVFQIDQFEVTVAAYETCVDAGNCTLPGTGGSCNWEVADRLSHPINCVDWEQAQKYCVSLGKQLPTEDQWEKAARGTDGRVYPWGNSFDPTRANVNGIKDGFDETTAPVGRFATGHSPYYAFDMAGNVWEWTRDCDPSVCYFRGGSWVDGPRHARASFRNRLAPAYRFNDLGFRCALPLNPER